MQKNLFKKIKPITPSQRSLRRLLKPKFYVGRRLKLRSVGLPNKAGRNNRGCITVFQKGGGHKRVYRLIDFSRKNAKGIVVGLEYDPYRNAFIARIFNDSSKEFYYIIAPKNLMVGSYVASDSNAEIKVGHALPFSKIPVGMLIHNISCKDNNYGQYARSAGTFAQLIQKTKKHARIRLSSGEQRLIPLTAFATLGIVSNENFKLTTLGKAGRTRWKNCRPHVRGVAMNPVDHPHGGGEGKTSGGRPSVTPWGKPTKGSKTSRSRNLLVVVPRKK